MGKLLPRRTVRLRFTILYAVLFLVSGVGLLAITYLLAGGKTTQPAPDQNATTQQPSLAAAQERIRQLEAQLSDIHAVQSRQLLMGSLIALAVMVAVSLLLGKAVAGRVLRPLRTITATTRRISAQNLHERLAVPGPADEVKDLADTIDGLLERLEVSFAAQRRFVANASHELRTPLATMRASLDVAVAKPEPAPPQTLALAGRLRTELDRVDRLLESFLVLARAQHGALADRAPVSLSNLVSEAMTAHAAAIAAKDLTIRTDMLDAAWTQGSSTLLSRMAANVVENAVIHNRHGGWVRVVTTTGKGSAQLIVETGGPMLDQEQVARLAQPFHFPELILRVRALARRRPSARARIMRAAGIELDPVRRTASRDGRQLDLSVKEFALLEALLRASPAFLSTEDLLEQVWDENADPFTNTVTVTIGRLRRKLGMPPVITTTPGVGYRIADLRE
jgi:signal transduction histidine kinase